MDAPAADKHRLAELVVHLTGCDPQRALDLVDRGGTPAVTIDDKLDRVARALVRLRRDATVVDLDDEAATVDLRDGVEAAESAT